MKDKQKLKDTLHEGVVDVEFTKADGSVRKMKATLNSQMLEVLNHNTAEDFVNGVENSKKPKTLEPDNIVRVFDIDIREWRSFRIDRLISFVLTDNDNLD